MQNNNEYPINQMSLKLQSKSCNEAFARVVVAAFASQLDPSLEELSDIKTAVSEAVTNSIIHGYEMKDGYVYISAEIYLGYIKIVIEDEGIGILDIEKAKTPLYTTKPEMERSGMGFSVMESFMDELKIESQPLRGTRIIMKKTIGKRVLA